MRTFFDWSLHPDISEFVAAHYTSRGPRDLSVQIADQFKVHLEPCQIRKRWRVLSGENAEQKRQARERANAQVEVAALDTAFRNQNTPRDFDRIAEMYDAATEDVERKEADQLGQTFLSVNFAAERLPIGICFWSDWQVGTNGVMMRQLRQDTQAIAAAEGLHTVLMGDLIQCLNMVKHPSSMHEMTLPDVQDQLDCVRLLIHETLGKKPLDLKRPKILAAITGNHEMNAKKAAGLDPTAGFCKEFAIPYLWHGGRLDLAVGQSHYTLGIRHLFRGESGVNTTNVQRMMYQNWLPADVEVLGHRHYNDMQKRPMPGRDTIFLRTGSYQKWDEHGQFSGGYKGQWGLATVILFPDTKRIVPFYGSDFYVALEFLEDQRRRYREKTVGK